MRYACLLLLLCAPGCDDGGGAATDGGALADGGAGGAVSGEGGGDGSVEGGAGAGGEAGAGGAAGAGGVGGEAGQGGQGGGAGQGGQGGGAGQGGQGGGAGQGGQGGGAGQGGQGGGGGQGGQGGQVGDDRDMDGVPNAEDNCPDDANNSQRDGDADGVGDPCDNCPDEANAGQQDEDGDGTGDACEGAPPRLVLDPDALHFRDLALCETIDATVRVRVPADAPPACVERPRLRGDGCDAFAVADWPRGDCVEVEPGGVVEVRVEFTAVGGGEFACRMTVLGRFGEEETEGEVQLTGRGVAPVEVFEQEEIEAVDLLLALDDSGSMLEVNSLVAEGFDALFGDAGDVDWRLGAVLIGLDDPDAEGHLIGQPKVIRAGPDAREQYAERIDVGSQGGGRERGLRAVELALSEALLDGPNAGFRRPEAELVVVYITDEEDQSEGVVGGYIESLFAAVPRRQKLRAHAIVGAEGGRPANCEGLVGFGAAGRRYAEVIEATAGRLESICTQRDYDRQLGRIGAAAFGPRRAFLLENRLGVGEVLVDGREAEDWDYDSDANAVVFEEPPPVGARIEVQTPNVVCD